MFSKVVTIFAAVLLIVGLSAIADVEVWLTSVTEGDVTIATTLVTPNGYVNEDFYNNGFAVFSKYAAIDDAGLYEVKYIDAVGLTFFHEFSVGPLGYINEGFVCLGAVSMNKELTIDGLYQEEIKNISGDCTFAYIWTDIGWYNDYDPAVEEVFIAVELVTDTTWDWVTLDSFAWPGQGGEFTYSTLIIDEPFDYYQYVEMELW
jgi:hypothetical protein